jgi:hypothetical protein
MTWRKSNRCGNGSCVEVNANWRKSTRSGPYSDNCVEVASDWFKSSFSGGGDCVEIKFDWRKSTRSEPTECVEVKADETVYVRDTKDRQGPMLSFTRLDWQNFLTSLNN